MSDTDIEKVQLCLKELESMTPIAFSIEDSEVLRHLDAVLKRKEIPMDKEFQIRNRINNLWEKFHNILKCHSSHHSLARAQCKKQVRYTYIYNGDFKLMNIESTGNNGSY
jgi:hypothetical protein